MYGLVVSQWLSSLIYLIFIYGSAEDRREYLESLLRECKKEAAAPVLDDEALNDLLARRFIFVELFTCFLLGFC